MKTDLLFEEGDRVVVKNGGPYNKSEGVVVDVDPGDHLAYKVRLQTGPIDMWFCEDELEFSTSPTLNSYAYFRNEDDENWQRRYYVALGRDHLGKPRYYATQIGDGFNSPDLFLQMISEEEYSDLKEPKVEEMTLEEVCMALGKTIKIVK